LVPNYYQMNMVEKRAVELAFPRSIFVTFSGSELRSLFPKHLPIFYMYSIKRGVSSKPWFLDAAPRDLAFDAAS
jgi:L-tyrosine isonitrile synthase